MPKTWKPDESSRLARLVDLGLSDEQIGQEMGFARSTILKERCRLGLTWKSRAGKMISGEFSKHNPEGVDDDMEKQRKRAERGSGLLLALLNKHHCERL